MSIGADAMAVNMRVTAFRFLGKPGAVVYRKAGGSPPTKEFKILEFWRAGAYAVFQFNDSGDAWFIPVEEMIAIGAALEKDK